jgi:hypothetical protein
MGNSGFNPNKEGEESSVESISLTQIFEELCPIYMSYGMSYDEFWYGDAYRAKFYREAYNIQIKHRDEEFWIQGMYIYDALCKVSPILHAFSKSGTKPLPYPDKPYMSTIKGQISEEEKQKKIENERLVAQLHFEQWAKATAKKFKNKNIK